jgi:hypothetical protein
VRFALTETGFTFVVVELGVAVAVEPNDEVVPHSKLIDCPLRPFESAVPLIVALVFAIEVAGYVTASRGIRVSVGDGIDVTDEVLLHEVCTLEEIWYPEVLEPTVLPPMSEYAEFEYD